MNILYHFRVKGVGPERVHIAGIAGGFRSHGHRVVFSSPTNVDPFSSGDIVPSGGRFGSLLCFLSNKIPQFAFEIMEITYNILAFFKLVASIRNNKPYLIYERYSFYCVAGVCASKLFKLPIFIEVNEIAGFDRLRDQCFVKLCKRFEAFILRRADRIFAVSEFLANNIQKYGIDKYKIYVVPNGIDPVRFQAHIPTDELKETLGISNKFILGFVGYLVHWHRLEELLIVVSRICKLNPDVVLILVGDGECRASIEAKAKDLNVSDKLIITGRVNHTDVPNYISLFDIAIIPNSNEYRSPIKMFEYMVMGKPVVAPRLPPIENIVTDNVSGILFKNGDIMALEEALQKMISNKVSLTTMGMEGRRRVLESFTWDAHASKILRIFMESYQGAPRA